MNLNKLKPISGDASFRKFYRNKKNIIVFSKKDNKKNLLIYDAINKILTKNNLVAPKLINQKYHLNYIEVSDLGKITALDYIKRNKNKFKIFEKIMMLFFNFSFFL